MDALLKLDFLVSFLNSICSNPSSSVCRLRRRFPSFQRSCCHKFYERICHWNARVAGDRGAGWGPGSGLVPTAFQVWSVPKNVTFFWLTASKSGLFSHWYRVSLLLKPSMLCWQYAWNWLKESTFGVQAGWMYYTKTQQLLLSGFNSLTEHALWHTLKLEMVYWLHFLLHVQQDNFFLLLNM